MRVRVRVHVRGSCHFEQFTSSAPQDPLFWPLHGNAERFVMYLRVLSKKGAISLDEVNDVVIASMF